MYTEYGFRELRKAYKVEARQLHITTNQLTENQAGRFNDNAISNCTANCSTITSITTKPDSTRQAHRTTILMHLHAAMSIEQRATINKKILIRDYN